MAATISKQLYSGVQMLSLLLTTITLAFCSAFFGSQGNADEGMWLFNNLPKDKLFADHGFRPDEKWTDHLMRASVRFNVGGSASFVSSTGLVLTNHHVGSDALQKLSTETNDYLSDGFLAKTRADELPAADLELNQLVSIKDVTEKVNASVESTENPAEAASARRAVIAEIEKQGLAETGNRCNVITLYGGGRYHLYEYKKYTDVRLVWAPESEAAFFGGDADNFEYPRYCLDACIFRVYENDEPAKIEHFLKWNDDGPAEDDLVFVSGNPGSTSRIYTVNALKYERDVRMPQVLDAIRRREILLQQYSLAGPEFKRQANDEMLGYQNMRKAYMGMLAGLQDPSYMKHRLVEELTLLKRIEADPELAPYAGAWKSISQTQIERARLRKESFSLNTRSYILARSFVRMAIEDQKDDELRLPEYQESGRESLKQQLLSPAPIYRDLERTKLTDLIARALEIRGADSELAMTLLEGKSPSARAEQLVSNTRIDDLEFRTHLFESGPNSILTSDDPMLQMAMKLDKEERRIRQANEELDEVERQAYGQISEVMFALKGMSVYPDATFTLRLAYGTVKGYKECGKPVPAFTTFGGAFEHEQNHGALEPWRLPESWRLAKEKIMADTPLNFVCTADIIGGNSGSPVVNKDLELVGLIFDGNIQSLKSDFFFSDEQGRATSVHAGAISEALRSIYDAEHIANELGK